MKRTQVLLVLALGVSWLWASPVQAQGKTVAFVGDSLTYVSGDAITKAFKHDDVLTVTGHPGQPMAGMLSAVQAEVALHPSVLFIEVGTNDAYGNNPSWPTDLANELDAVASSRCVVFTTVNPRLGPVATGIDEALYVAAQRNRHHYVIVDWGNIEWQNPAWVGPDGIHPTGLGQMQYAKLLFGAMRKCR